MRGGGGGWGGEGVGGLMERMKRYGGFIINVALVVAPPLCFNGYSITVINTMLV